MPILQNSDRILTAILQDSDLKKLSGQQPRMFEVEPVPQISGCGAFLTAKETLVGTSRGKGGVEFADSWSLLKTSKATDTLRLRAL